MLILGGGVSAAATYYFLVNKLSSHPSLIANIAVWEKLSFVGGRMLSWHYHDDDNNPVANVRADMGAQYLTVQRQPSPYRSVYDTLVAKDVLAPLQEPIEGVRMTHHEQEHFIARRGTRAIVRSLLEGANVVRDRELIELNVSEAGDEWIARYSSSTGQTASASYTDICICITPSALFQIKGNWLERARAADAGVDDVFKKLQSTRFSSR
jgi:predicted NAD/FAD-dependent oxidoreductase